jgi:hypothetical protein
MNNDMVLYMINYLHATFGKQIKEDTTIHEKLYVVIVLHLMSQQKL